MFLGLVTTPHTVPSFSFSFFLSLSLSLSLPLPLPLPYDSSMYDSPPSPQVLPGSARAPIKKLHPQLIRYSAIEVCANGESQFQRSYSVPGSVRPGDRVTVCPNRRPLLP